jgi:hypothetical protein
MIGQITTYPLCQRIKDLRHETFIYHDLRSLGRTGFRRSGLSANASAGRVAV